MLALSDAQIRLITDAADALPPDKREVLLGRIGAALTLRGGLYDGGVEEIIRWARRGLVQQEARTADG